MGFMDGILDVLSGPMAQKQIDKNGFDWREQRAQDEFNRQQQREVARQANEKYNMQLGEDAIAGAPDGQTPDVSSLFPDADNSRKRLMIDALVGRGKERKSALSRQKAMDDAYLRGMNFDNQQRLLDKRLGVTTSEGQKNRDSRESVANSNNQNDLAIALARIAATSGGGKQQARKPYWNVKEGRTDFLTPDELASVPQGTYTDVTTGRQGATSRQQSGSTRALIQNLDDSLAAYEKTQEGLGRMIPSALSPTKAVAWDRYQSGLQSAAQMMGRKILADNRVSDQDRLAYARTIGQTSELMTAIDPGEARRRLNLLKSLEADYTSKYGGGDGGDQPGPTAPAGGGGGEPPRPKGVPAGARWDPATRRWRL